MLLGGVIVGGRVVSSAILHSMSLLLCCPHKKRKFRGRFRNFGDKNPDACKN